MNIYEKWLHSPRIQKWLKYLKDNPDKRHVNALGYVKNGELEYGCCLGAAEYLKESKYQDNGFTGLVKCDTGDPTNETTQLSEDSIIHYGLHDQLGEILRDENSEPVSLAAINDSKTGSWNRVVNFIENNPEKVFCQQILGEYYGIE